MSDKYPGNFVTTGAPAGFSVAFDGSGDYITGTGSLTNSNVAFTVEAWIYLTGATTNQSIFSSSSTTGSTNGINLWVNGGSFLTVSIGNGGAGTDVVGTTVLKSNTWYHVAACRTSGGAVSTFLNGVLTGSGTNSSLTTNTSFVISASYINSFVNTIQGYISNLRVVTGTALYSSTFTPPTQLFPISGTTLLTCQSPTIIDNSTNAFALTAAGDSKVSNFTPFAGYTGFNPALGAAAGGVWTLDEAAYYQGTRKWPIYDPYFNQTTLMLHGNSPTNQPLWIKDASINNFPLTVVGDTKASNQTPFNTSWSNQVGSFNAVSNYIATSSTTLMNFGTAAYTIEFWIFLPSYGSGTGYVYGNNQTSGAPQTYVNSNGQLVFQYVGTAAFATTTTAIALNTWTHVAIVRTSTSASGFAVYFNGVNGLTSTDSTNVTATTALWIGNSGTSPMAAGYISNFRVCKGTAVYSGNFTPSSSPLTTTSQGATNCVLLTCQNGYFVDNAATPSTLTLTNAPSIQYNNPFGNSLLTGGGGYFDGSGDYITLGGQSNFAFGSNAFTIEFWVYCTTLVGGAVIYDQRPSGSSGAQPMIDVTAAGILGYYTNAAYQITATTALTINTWNHVAVARSGTSTKLFLNGVQTGSTYTDSTSYVNGASRPVIAANGTNLGNNFSGYVSNLRVLNGTAVYTANFTVPTTPLTAVANTQLLSLQNTQPTNNSAFVDSSVNNFAITRFGNTTQGTFTPFSQTGWGMYLNGSSYVQPSGSTTTLLGGALSTSSVFTIEGWFNVPGSILIAGDVAATSNNNAFAAQISSTGVPQFGWWNGSSYTTQSSTGQVSFNTWNHIAWVVTGGNVNFYINGVLCGTSSVGNSSGSPGTIVFGGYNNSFAAGWYSNLRICKSAVYTSNFTPSTTPLLPISTCTLLTFQSNRFVDNSALNNTFTLGSAPSIQAFSPFVPTVTTPTTYSNWFDGSGDYLTVPSNAAFNLGSSTNWTIEGFYYPTSYTASNGVITNVYVSTGDKVTIVTIGTNGYLQYFINGSVAITSTTAGTLNAWNYFAVVRNSGTTTLYLNGVSLGTTATTPTNSSKAVSIGFDTTVGSAYFYGCISNVRITTGASLTVTTTPTAPLTTSVPAGTVQLLTCQNSTFVDNSTNNFTITATGNVQPVASPTPFPAKVDQTTLNTAYSTSLIGGSGYFDGSSDYLSSPDSPSLDLSGSTSWCVETWMYWSSVSGEQNIAEKFTPTTGPGWTLYKANAGTIQFYASSLFDSSLTPVAGQWYHIAVCRDNAASRTSFFVNGVRTATSTTFTIAGNAATPMLVGVRKSGTTWLNGYMAGLRIVKGQSVYDTTATGFVPPNAPFTTLGYGSTSQSITPSNLSLLFNYTNAGIYDNTAKNVLETVSSAAISTTQAKWGSSSMNFPVTTSAYLRGAISPNTKFPGAFTIEAWIYPTQVSARADIFATPTAASSGTGIYWYVNSSAFLTLDKGGGNLATSSIAISANRWTHVAATRNSSGAITLWTNGIASGTGSDTTNFSDGNLFVGTEYALANFWNGFIADLRVTNGVARYTTNFTPPTSQLQDQ